jgi:hypothetical protein
VSFDLATNEHVLASGERISQADVDARADTAIATITATPVVAPFTVPEFVAVVTTSEKYADLQAEVVTALGQVRALPSYPALRSEMTTALESAKALMVTDADSYTRAGALVGTLGALADRAKDWWGPACAIAFTLHRWLTTRRAADVDPLERERKRILADAGTWKAEQDRLQAEQDARAAAAQKELDDELALMQALTLQNQGQPELASAVLEEAAAAPAPPVSTPSLVPTGVGFTHGEDYEIKVLKPDLVPREYLVPDEKKILRVVKAMKGVIRIPGVQITKKPATGGRRRAS